MSKYLPEGWNQDKIDEALEFQSQQKDKFMNKAEKPEIEKEAEARYKKVQDQFNTYVIPYKMHLEIISAIAKASAEAYTAGRKAQMEADGELIRSIDPLAAVCDWENNDAIAYAVQKYLCEAIRNQGDVE